MRGEKAFSTSCFHLLHFLFVSLPMCLFNAAGLWGQVRVYVPQLGPRTFLQAQTLSIKTGIMNVKGRRV